MIVPASATTASIYKHVVKPVLFKQQPDAVHSRLIRGGGALQRLVTARGILRAAWAYRNDAALNQTIHGITFRNPVGLSAGFDKNFELPPLLKAIGFGFMEGGSLTYRYCSGNPRPWFYRLPKTKSIVVYAGLGNQGVEAIIRKLQSYPPDTFTDFPLNISVAKTNSPEACSETEAIADYAGSLKKLEQAHLGSIYTLNISCPNTYGGEPFTTPDRLGHLLDATDALHLSKPLYIKMPSHLPWPEFKRLVAIAARHQVNGLTISNLAKDRSQVTLKDPLSETIKGNLSGLPTQKLSDELIRKTYQAFRGRFVIIGVGGIFCAEDAYRKIRYGATMVELITGMIFEGPQLIGQINRDLVRLLKADGYTNISQAIGADVH
jgi:dihydroorotate dehydrogenase